jgi:hypothetical protein
MDAEKPEFDFGRVPKAIVYSGYLKLMNKKPTAALVYTLYISHTNDEMKAWPSIARLVELSGCSRSAVSDARRFLLAERFLVFTGEHRGRSPVMRVETSPHELLAAKIANQPVLPFENDTEQDNLAPAPSGAQRPAHRAQDGTFSNLAPDPPGASARPTGQQRPAGTALIEKRIEKEEAEGTDSVGAAADSNSESDELAAAFAGWGIGEPTRSKLVERTMTAAVGRSVLIAARESLDGRTHKTGLLITELNAAIDRAVATRDQTAGRIAADSAAATARRAAEAKENAQFEAAARFVTGLSDDAFGDLVRRYNETAPVPVKGLRGSNLTASVLYRFAGCQKETTPKMEAAAHADGLPAGN